MASAGRAPAGRRDDIEGLRALAVLLVVTYHVWLGRVSGGVDVFLFLSAFFLTGGLVRRLEREERVDLRRYWLRIFQRLLPAAAVVVAATVVAVWLLLPATRWRAVLVDAAGSTAYVENWVLAQRAVDYYAADKGAASPLQHMWSLSVQGQVFLLWPVLLVLLAVLARRTRVPVRAAVGAGLGAVAAASFWYAVATVGTRQSFAYFDTGARLWEFALGGLLALVVTRVRVSAVVAVPLGWAGVAGLLSCGLLLDVTRSFPGLPALWPLAAAAAVVLTGTAPSRWGVGRVLSAARSMPSGCPTHASSSAATRWRCTGASRAQRARVRDMPRRRLPPSLRHGGRAAGPRRPRAGLRPRRPRARRHHVPQPRVPDEPPRTALAAAAGRGPLRLVPPGRGPRLRGMAGVAPAQPRWPARAVRRELSGAGRGSEAGGTGCASKGRRRPDGPVGPVPARAGARSGSVPPPALSLRSSACYLCRGPAPGRTRSTSRFVPHRPVLLPSSARGHSLALASSRE
ncbi:acyltransferase family protein [Phycicoccus sp. CSK15P-2]|nr:acyltransferase family protein [Phycicoccus sp. CSK15P-2]